MSGKFYTKFSRTNGKAGANSDVAQRGEVLCSTTDRFINPTGSRGSASVVALGRRPQAEIQPTMHQERQR